MLNVVNKNRKKRFANSFFDLYLMFKHKHVIINNCISAVLIVCFSFSNLFCSHQKEDYWGKTRHAEMNFIQHKWDLLILQLKGLFRYYQFQFWIELVDFLLKLESKNQNKAQHPPCFNLEVNHSGEFKDRRLNQTTRKHANFPFRVCKTAAVFIHDIRFSSFRQPKTKDNEGERDSIYSVSKS